MKQRTEKRNKHFMSYKNNKLSIALDWIFIIIIYVTIFNSRRFVVVRDPVSYV